MAPNIGFLAGPGYTIQDLAGSGLGFFGTAGFGASVQVGFWQGRTFITNGAGTTQGPECNNVTYVNPTTGILGQSGSGLPLPNIPNWQSTVNIRFTNDTPVQTQNVQLCIFDRNIPANPPSGVTTAVAEIVHPNINQAPGGSGSPTWQFPAGTGVMMLTASPGTSGLRPNGPATRDTQHDWYLVLSASPNNIGSKTNYGLYVSLEFL